MPCLHKVWFALIVISFGPACPLNAENTLPLCSPLHSFYQAIFFGGIDPSIRGEVWPFLLHYYSYDSSSQEREDWRLQKRSQYHDIQQRRYVCGSTVLTSWSLFKSIKKKEKACIERHLYASLSETQINYHVAAVSAAKCSVSQTLNHMWAYCGFSSQALSNQ